MRRCYSALCIVPTALYDSISLSVFSGKGGCHDEGKPHHLKFVGKKPVIRKVSQAFLAGTAGFLLFEEMRGIIRLSLSGKNTEE